MIKHACRALVFLCAFGASLSAPAANLTVSAAASLREAFTEIGFEFERVNQPHRVQFNFGASGQLLQQITRGAPVDVFAAADLDTMDRAEKANLIFRDTRANFARNQMVVVVKADSKAVPESLRDLLEPRFGRIAMGNPDSVPAGRYAKSAMEAAELRNALGPKTINTQNVRQTLDYVARDEADAGFVYLTDALSMRERVKIAFTVPLKTPILYPIAAIKGWGNEKLSRKFVDFVTGDTAQRILAKYQFGTP
jgi:molybdate transport system substrate-binding protein